MSTTTTSTATSAGVTAATTLAEAVIANPAAARVFERHGLDYCCHGQRSISDAAGAAGLEAAAVVAELDGLGRSEQPWADLDPPALADHVVAEHHAYLHEELPLLEALAAKVASVHGARHPELAEVHRLAKAVHEDLEPHMVKEERILFPAIHAVGRGERDFPFGSIENPIRMMVFEHEATGELLEELRRVTDDYALPDDACASYTSLYERLDAAEHDTHLHIHKENHILFPAALRLFES